MMAIGLYDSEYVDTESVKMFASTRTGRTCVPSVRVEVAPGFRAPSCSFLAGFAWPFLVIFRGHQPRLSVHLAGMLGRGVHKTQAKAQVDHEEPAEGGFCQTVVSGIVRGGSVRGLAEPET